MIKKHPKKKKKMVTYSNGIIKKTLIFLIQHHITTKTSFNESN